jgi:large subunit ribosomal protein L23
MAILDFLKNKEDAQKAKQGKKTVKKTVKASVEPVVKPTVQKSSKKAVSFSYEAIKKPRISEKATLLAESNQYTFEVSPNYNKTEIKKAVEGIYGVNVLSVNIIVTPPKKRRMGKKQGWRKEFTKAVVKIKDGQKIEII